MDIQLQELIDKIKKDGIESASADAARIRAEAEAEAKRIIAAAKKEAEILVERGKRTRNGPKSRNCRGSAGLP